MTTNSITLRPGQPSDAQRCADICFDAFGGINRQHGFPSDFTSPQMSAGLMQMLFSNPHAFSVVAEQEGRIIGSNFLWDGVIGGIGPLTVDPAVQEQGAGRMMMQWAIELGTQRKMAGVRLIQAGFNMRSLALYTRLGFEIREPLACMQGKPLKLTIDGHAVRQMSGGDIENCCTVAFKVHGHDRRGELHAAVAQESARVVERGGEITGYTTGVGFFGHSVALKNSDLLALIGAAEQFTGPGFLLPTRNAQLFRWCLDHGLRIVQPLTLMSRGLYNDPAGAFLASILF